MLKTWSLAFLASASFAGAGSHPAAAFDSADYVTAPRVYYADQPARPVQRTAYAERPRMGGGFIEFLFSDSAQGQPYPPPPAYEPRRGMLPVDPQQAMRQPDDTIDAARPAMDPKFEPQMVEYSGRESAGTIVVDTPSKFLFLVQGDGRAMRYGIGVGKPGFTWAGVKTITAKKEWPAWTPPPEMLLRRPDLPRHMAGGPDNPLGARAMYLGTSLYRIHGSNEPWTIGTNVSSGCIRMRNEDVIDLYGRVSVGAKVVVI
ncbi:L,D-transpeptidase [Tardiphaga sp. vice352]|uniref:L,D-transpeptidase n=1 Tax=unclassified Tardiphaga TaxID=2631404 RepID=UPI001162BAF4|nr:MULTISPECIES: L,D-transpeptidase [unclassified Tardiphaga]QDM18354.1 L,D-transpeptidase [Tardiphaga sp. vice278]QDM23358.1 L,D-transpeptidase [Tardiphaga sp. vice154]QDM28578.1 L,D-transpeptidase [Tardiphaga sp. vice304]QDM33678.1 L,D-transpeptidase [Tardiphaga sp. vice352]